MCYSNKYKKNALRCISLVSGLKHQLEFRKSDLKIESTNRYALKIKMGLKFYSMNPAAKYEFHRNSLHGFCWSYWKNQRLCCIDKWN